MMDHYLRSSPDCSANLEFVAKRSSAHQWRTPSAVNRRARSARVTTNAASCGIPSSDRVNPSSDHRSQPRDAERPTRMMPPVSAGESYENLELPVRIRQVVRPGTSAHSTLMVRARSAGTRRFRSAQVENVTRRTPILTRSVSRISSVSTAPAKSADFVAPTRTNRVATTVVRMGSGADRPTRLLAQVTWIICAATTPVLITIACSTADSVEMTAASPRMRFARLTTQPVHVSFQGKNRNAATPISAQTALGAIPLVSSVRHIPSRLAQSGCSAISEPGHSVMVEAAVASKLAASRWIRARSAWCHRTRHVSQVRVVTTTPIVGQAAIRAHALFRAISRTIRSAALAHRCDAFVR